MAKAMSFGENAIAARETLLDAVTALERHRDSLVLVGAQAIYLYTGDTDVAIATSTKDSDIALIQSTLPSYPTLDDAMSKAGFSPDLEGHQGTWYKGNIPIDLLVPKGDATERGARIPPHSKTAALYVKGIEGAEIDNRFMTIESLRENDSRKIEMRVAGPAALVVAKTFKIAERIDHAEKGLSDRTNDKDAHDLYRLLRKVKADEVIEGMNLLRRTDSTNETTVWAIEALRRHASSADAKICVMAGRTEATVGDPEEVAESTWALIQDVVDGL